MAQSISFAIAYSAEFSAGAWEHLSKDLQVVLDQEDTPIFDKIPAYTIQIMVLSSYKNNHEEAIAVAVNVLKELGIIFVPLWESLLLLVG